MAATVVLLFLTGALLWAVVDLPVALDRNAALFPLVLGFTGGVLFFSFFSRPLAVYVFGHELTHWLAAKLFLRRTAAFHAGAAGGSVAVERPNIWIALAPYFFPVYTVLWIGLYGAYCFWQRAAGPAEWAVRTAYAGVGATYAFHVVLTAYALLRGQRDLRLYGRILSLTFIFFCNVLLVFLGLVLVSRQYGVAAALVWERLGREWAAVHAAARALWGLAARAFFHFRELMSDRSVPD